MELSMLMVLSAMSVICLDLAVAKSSPAIMQDNKMRFSQKLNAVSSTPKPEFHYQPLNQYQSIQPDKHQYQHQNILPPVTQQHQFNFQQPQLSAQLNPHAQQQILQLIQKALYTTQQNNQPTAMIIIAQPAFLPANVAYGGQPAQTQQLLNYFHSNPQARYQFLHGNTHQEPPQQLVQLPAPTHNSEHYQILQNSQNFNPLPTPQPLTTHMAPIRPSETYQGPHQLQQVSHLSQQFPFPSKHFSYPSQQYDVESRQQEQDQEVPLRSLPPIITGFENFSPEQQAKIKAQLSEVFGAPLQPLAGRDQVNENGGVGNNEKYSHYSSTNKHQFGALSLGQNRESENAQFSPKYQTISTRLNMNQFIPNQQVKTNGGNSNVMHVAKSSYPKM